MCQTLYIILQCNSILILRRIKILIGILTDIHFDVRGGSQYFLDRYNEFFEKQFFPYMDKHNIKVLLLGGDTWESRKHINVNTMYYVKRMFFEKLKERNIETITILGNHDVVYKNTNKIHSMEFVEDTYSNFRTIYDTQVIDFDGCPIGFVSWINKENFDERLDFIKNAKCEYLLGHFEINGFEMTKGHACENGLKAGVFKNYVEVWSGHFHIRNKVGNVRYLGNPFQTNRGDIGYARGFHVFDTATRELEFIENEYNIYESLHFHDEIDIATVDFSVYVNKTVIVYVPSLLDANTDVLNLFVDRLNNVAYKVEVEETRRLTVDNIDVDDVDVKTHTEIIGEYVDNVMEHDAQRSKVKEIMIERYAECINDE